MYQKGQKFKLGTSTGTAEEEDIGRIQLIHLAINLPSKKLYLFLPKEQAERVTGGPRVHQRWCKGPEQGAGREELPAAGRMWHAWGCGH